MSLPYVHMLAAPSRTMLTQGRRVPLPVLVLAGSPSSRSAVAGLGAGIGVGMGYTECKFDFDNIAKVEKEASGERVG